MNDCSSSDGTTTSMPSRRRPSGYIDDRQLGAAARETPHGLRTGFRVFDESAVRSAQKGHGSHSALWALRSALCALMSCTLASARYPVAILRSTLWSVASVAAAGS